MNFSSTFAQPRHSELTKTNNHGPFLVSKKNKENLIEFPKGGSWTLKENARYIAFIMKYQENSVNKYRIKKWLMFESMSMFISTRNFRQCKSHHQRVTSYFDNVAMMVDCLIRENKSFEVFLFEEKIELKKWEKENYICENFYFEEERNINTSTKSEYQTVLETLGSYSNDENYQRPRQDEFYNIYEMEGQTNEWIECHFLFLQWVEKVREILIYDQKIMNLSK